MKEINDQEQAECKSLVVLAHQLAEDNRREDAFLVCDHVVRNYHWCQAAPEAKKMLEGLKTR